MVNQFDVLFKGSESPYVFWSLHGHYLIIPDATVRYPHGFSCCFPDRVNFFKNLLENL